ncbi:hypothetical protein PC116_g11091 [Phytophthora cactorum]|uniref:Uncharacterized protein n=1 Tax=Phytophthora cactorum TaxID=29920 RepID=A0A8T1KXK5_9STRA|nr:hypothetical protein PC117_g8972 [Phytophthora cactorum]KAG3023759.1 hypothetical protein PC119_g8765 [Phytophthora cactorum]KAG3027914.1 hypothetical protein PC120_g5135 [Phytophthora cactorum]KAG3174765.1 hypothetical protein C6341_g9717 [Phytophthora cactorum]KAG3193188.1 hypothetical protein PC128_g10254 [Phytophthora cactorum]
MSCRRTPAWSLASARTRGPLVADSAAGLSTAAGCGGNVYDRLALTVKHQR